MRIRGSCCSSACQLPNRKDTRVTLTVVVVLQRLLEQVQTPLLQRRRRCLHRVQIPASMRRSALEQQQWGHIVGLE